MTLIMRCRRNYLQIEDLILKKYLNRFILDKPCTETSSNLQGLSIHRKLHAQQVHAVEHHTSTIVSAKLATICS